MKSLPLLKIRKTFGYIPHPVSFFDNPNHLSILSMLFNVPVLDIVGVDIGLVNDDNFNSVKSDEAKHYHIDELSFVIFTS